MNNVLVINSGSSSIKYQLFQMHAQAPVCVGLIERIGLNDGVITHKILQGGKEKKVIVRSAIANHEEGMLSMTRLLIKHSGGIINDPANVNIVGHRIVHGGERFTEPTIITSQVKKEIKKLFNLAPLHNPGNFKGIEVAERTFNKAIQIAVFDTAFHQTLPEKAFRYATPETFYKNFGIRVYGFHGTSHKYVSAKAMQYLNMPDARIISLHLGNGCSAAAIKGGRCLDTSMGLTPLDGLVMGTRCGSIDASVLLHLMNQQGYTAERLSGLLNKQSGMLGLTGKSDMRDIRKMMNEGDERAKLAYDMYAYRIRKFIGAYINVLGGLDAIVFTGGVGENDALLREMVCSDMDWYETTLDHQKNQSVDNKLREINANGSFVKLLVIPTNEELEIASQCMKLLKFDLVSVTN